MEKSEKNPTLKIKFIILGWYYEKCPDLINELIELKKDNPEIIDVFYACHKEPPQIINFGLYSFASLSTSLKSTLPVSFLTL